METADRDFLENARTITLGELKDHFGFRELNDIRKLVNHILLLSGVTSTIQKPNDTVVLTGDRINKILRSVSIWQEEQQKITAQKAKEWLKKTSSKTRSIGVDVPNGYISFSNARTKYGAGYIEYLNKKDTVPSNGRKSIGGKVYFLESWVIETQKEYRRIIENPKKLKSKRRTSSDNPYAALMRVYGPYLDS